VKFFISIFVNNPQKKFCSVFIHDSIGKKGFYNMTTIQTSDGSQYQTAGRFKNLAAGTAGYLVVGAVASSQNALTSPAMRAIKNLNTSIDTVELRNTINTALKNSNTNAKIVDFSTRPTKYIKHSEIVKMFSDISKKAQENDESFLTILKNIGKTYKKTVNKILINHLSNGENAVFCNEKNKVLINIDKIGTSGFHEIGHAINFNNSKFWRGMQKMRLPFMILPTAIMAITLGKRKKLEGEEPKNPFDKATDFIKNNAGKLSAAAFIPIIAEETMASIRGNKMAKKLCSPELFKKVAKSNALGGLTYAITALITGFSVYAGGKVKDSMATPKKIDA